MPKHISRPTFTVCVDVETRMIVGHHVHFEPPGVNSVPLSLQQAIQHAGPWDDWGRPAEILIDWSREFHSASLQQVPNESEPSDAPELDPES